MSLKNYLSTDINSVFMNTDEFADDVTINGKSVRVVIDEEKLTELNETLSLNGRYGDIFYFTNKDDWKKTFGRLPMAGDAQMFNSVPCEVIDVGNTYGVLSITLAYRRG